VPEPEKTVAVEPVPTPKQEVTPVAPVEKTTPVVEMEKPVTAEPAVVPKVEVAPIAPVTATPVAKPKEPTAPVKVELDSIFPLEPVSASKEFPIKKATKSDKKAKKTAKAKNTEDEPVLSLDDLSTQITQVAEKYANPQPTESENRTKSLKSVGKHKVSASQYISDWQAKVERIGNRNYPQIARQQDFSAKLIMEVGVKSDGSIARIKIKKSSGIPELDEAAKNIVRMGEPYPALPSQLAEELDVLTIRRVWLFSDESMTTQ
jgi:protein TonB